MVDLQTRVGGASTRNQPTGCEAGGRDRKAARGGRSRAGLERSKVTAGQRADQDGDEGARLDQPIAADDLGLAQHLRQD